MKNQRDKYLKPIIENDFQLQCPHCDNGLLEMLKETFCEESTETSKKEYDISEEISSLDTKFITFMRCNSSKCKETVIVSGTKFVDEHDSCDCYPLCDEDCVRYPVYTNYYKIEYINSPINIIKISDNVPDTVKSSIKKSFFLFWCDTEASANKIRSASEFIMDEMGIDTKGINKYGKSYDKTLHERIEDFGKKDKGKYEELSKMLIGVKWLGNAGSHKDQIGKEDLLDVYDVLDYILPELFSKEAQKLNVIDISNKLEGKFKPIKKS